MAVTHVRYDVIEMTDKIEYKSTYFMEKLDQLDLETLILYNHLLTIQKRNGNIQEDVFINLESLFIIIKENLLLLADNDELLKQFMIVLHNTIHLTEIANGNNDQCIEFLVSLKTDLIDSKTDALYIQFAHEILQTFIEIGGVLKNYEILKDVLTYMFSENALIQARAVICVKILLEHFEINVLSSIWERAETTRNIKVLIHVFEYFLEESNILADIRFWQLLVEKFECHEISERKCAIFIMKRIIKFFSEGTSKVSKDVENYFEWDSTASKYWSIYFTIFENLCENQSHLILPSLELLKTIRLPSIWMQLLLMEMLKHKNVLVLKWSVKYVLESMTINGVNDRVLTEFMKALNNTFLYVNDSISVHSFISTGYQRFINAMIHVEWKSVPFHTNLKALQSVNEHLAIVDLQFLINFAIKIRKVQNRRIRHDMRLIYFNIFERSILKLSVSEGVKLVESLYNKHEALDDHIETILSQLINKADCTISVRMPIKTLCILTNRDSLILRSHQLKLFTIADLDLTALLVILSLNNISDAVHDTVRAKIATAICPFSLTLNEINTDNAENCELNFLKFYVYLHLSCSENENKLIIQQCLELMKRQFDVIGRRGQFKCDFNILKPKYVDRLTTALIKMKLNHLIDENTESLIDLGGMTTMQNILNCLQEKGDNEARVIVERILIELKFMLKKRGFDGSVELCRSFSNFCNKSKLGNEYLEKLIELDHGNPRFVSYFYHACNLVIARPDIKYLLRGLLYGEPLHGEQKIEYDYAGNLNRIQHSDSFEVRQSCFRILFEFSSKGEEGNVIFSKIKDNLLNASVELNKTKPRYFDNSEQHRLKLRLVQAIAVLQSLHSEWDDRFLISIFNESNQNNVTYIMELVIAQALNKSQLIDMISKLPSYQSSALPSIFAINYMACRKFDDVVLATKSVELILPWTMAPHFKTRLNAQISIFHLLKYFKGCGERFHYLLEGICTSLQQGNAEQNLTRLHCDFRYNDLNYTNLLDAKNILIHIPRITNMATDELYREDMWQLFSLDLDTSSINMRHSKHARIIKQKAIPDEPMEMVSYDVQRKMIPNSKEVDPKLNNNSKKDNTSEMLVVASLIRKHANLGGIARTCEVLGIKNLVIDSFEQAETKEFQTLSLTAEKWLNIEEVKTRNLFYYLNSKKMEGYRILGAEQTTNSVSFLDFKFPKKCILLLGHEKEGIPANLIAILDHAIEIPQFGVVRSLNVHVAGALFMWEYCKQHLAK